MRSIWEYIVAKAPVLPTPLLEMKERCLKYNIMLPHTIALLAHDNDGVVASAHLNLEERVDHLQDGLRGGELASLGPLGVVELSYCHGIRRALENKGKLVCFKLASVVIVVRSYGSHIRRIFSHFKLPHDKFVGFFFLHHLHL